MKTRLVSDRFVALAIALSSIATPLEATSETASRSTQPPTSVHAAGKTGPPRWPAKVVRHGAAPPGRNHALEGKASYYWQDQMTASGERFDRHALTAAHRTLPFGTRARVTNTLNGRSVVVRINDRGPWKATRVIDLSEAAAKAVGMERMGLAPVTIEVIGRI